MKINLLTALTILVNFPLLPIVLFQMVFEWLGKKLDTLEDWYQEHLLIAPFKKTLDEARQNKFDAYVEEKRKEIFRNEYKGEMK